MTFIGNTLHHLNGRKCMATIDVDIHIPVQRTLCAELYKQFTKPVDMGGLQLDNIDGFDRNYRNHLVSLRILILKTLAYPYRDMNPPLSHFFLASVPGGKSNSGRCRTSTRTDNSAWTNGRSWPSSNITISCNKDWFRIYTSIVMNEYQQQTQTEHCLFIL